MDDTTSMRMNRFSIPALVVFVFAVTFAWISYQVFFLSSPIATYGAFGDEGVMLNGAARILDGQVPHRDFQLQVLGTSYVPLALWFKAFGEGYRAAQWYNIATAVAICILLYWATRPVLKLAAVVPALLFGFVFYSVWPFVSYHWTFLLLAIASYGVLARSCSRRAGTIAGIIAALGILTVQNKGAMLALANVAILLLATRGQRLRAFGWYALGLGVPLLAAGITGLALHIGHAIIRQTFLNNVHYYGDIVGKAFFGLNQVSMTVIFLLVLFACPFFNRRWMTGTFCRHYIVLYAITAVASLSMLYHSEWIHFAQIAILPVLLSTFVIRRIVADLRTGLRWSSAWSLMSPFIAIALFGFWAISIIAFYEVDFVDHAAPSEHLAFETERGKVNLRYVKWSNVVLDAPAVQKLTFTTYANRRLFFLSHSPGYYYFFRLKNETSFDFVDSDIMALKDQELLKEQLRTQVDAVVMFPYNWPEIPKDGWLVQWVAAEFPVQSTAAKGLIRVYERSSSPMSERAPSIDQEKLSV